MFIEIIIMIHYLKETISINFNKKTNKYVIFICLFILIISNNTFINYKSSDDFFTGPFLYITLLIIFILPLLTLIKSLLYENT